MRLGALFLNGVYEHVLADIAKVQSTSPEQILYLQPYSSAKMAQLYKGTRRPATPSLFTCPPPIILRWFRMGARSSACGTKESFPETLKRPSLAQSQPSSQPSPVCTARSMAKGAATSWACGRSGSFPTPSTSQNSACSIRESRQLARGRWRDTGGMFIQAEAACPANKRLEPTRWPARLRRSVAMTSNVKSCQRLF